MAFVETEWYFKAISQSGNTWQMVVDNGHETLLECSEQPTKLPFSFQQMLFSEVWHHQVLNKM